MKNQNQPSVKDSFVRVYSHEMEQVIRIYKN